MKGMSRTICTLAMLLMSLGAVTSANAIPALARFSPAAAKDPNGVVIGGTGGTVATGALPAWFQDSIGVAVKPCLDVARCLAAGAPDFNPALPLSYPTNFPSEAFYFNATANFTMLGASDVLVVNALEFTFLNALGGLTSPVLTPTASGNPFQRIRLVHTFIGGGGNLFGAAPGLGAPAGGVFTVTGPWGVTTFAAADTNLVKCVNQGGDTKCSMTRDQPTAGPNPTAALGDSALAPGSISTFLKDPTAPAGFLGLGAATIGYTGGALGNTITVTDPFGRSSLPIAGLKILMGQTVGLEITPPAAGNNFGAVSGVRPAPIAVPKTFIVNNLTGAIVPAFAITPNNPEFTIVPSAAIVPPATQLCVLGVDMAVGVICNFDVTFTPNPAVDGAKTATILLTGTGAPTAQITVTGTADSTPPAITPPATFARVSNPVLSGTVEAGAIVKVGTAPAVVTNTTWSIKLPSLLKGANAITVTATDAAGNTATSTTNVTGATPDGKVATPTAATPVSIADALLALKFVAGLSVLTDEQKVHADVAPLVGGIPAPNDKLDIGDVVLILRKVVAPAELPGL